MQVNIYAVKTKNGVYVTDELHADGWNRSSLGSLLFDGKKPKHTFHKSWFRIEKEPDTVQRWVRQPSINCRYELIDPSLASETIPGVVKLCDAIDPDDGELTTWFSTISSLYTKVCDEQPDILEDVGFSLNVVLELDYIVEYNGFSYPAQTGKYRDDMGAITQDSAQHQILDQILFPAIVLPMRPCKLSSQESYQIVREFIKQHIDLRVAHVSSDYNFCFAVEKVIALRDPYTSKTEITNARGKSYKNKRWRETYIKSRKFKVFEMTWSPENYKGYTPIQEFMGDDIADLKAKIDAYCQELIEIINEPLKDCPHCDGMGVVLEENDAK